MSIKKIMLASGLMSLVATASAFADGFQSPSDASGVVSTFVGDLGTTLQTSVPVVLAVAAALLGVYILWRMARRTIK